MIVLAKGIDGGRELKRKLKTWDSAQKPRKHGKKKDIS